MLVRVDRIAGFGFHCCTSSSGSILFSTPNSVFFFPLPKAWAEGGPGHKLMIGLDLNQPEFPLSSSAVSTRERDCDYTLTSNTKSRLPGFCRQL